MVNIEQMFVNAWTPVATLLVFLALAGWGMTIARCLRFRYLPDPGLSAAFGLAFSVVLGGILNRFGLISLTFGRVYLMLGVLLCLAAIFEHRQSFVAGIARMIRNPFLLVGILVIAYLVIIMLFEAGVSNFNPHDDYYGYLVFPLKMLQTGSLGADPFNMRQLITSLRGDSFLLTLMLGVLDLNRLHCLELGVGVLMGMTLVMGHILQRQSPAWM
ncbi:MAG: hypothetical protein Q7J98_04495, partial [Kiritimatiellia bacterium]|nr:hypothetical protein [Kiritimatiellia bacterium]